MTAGRVGKPHGHDGSFYVDGADHPFAEGDTVLLSGRPHVIERRAGTDSRPLVRLSGVPDPAAVRGELMLVEASLAEDEWLASDLVGLPVAGRGRVARVVAGPSCSVLELDDGTLVPFISDAVASVGPEEIVLNEDFLG